MATRKGCLAAAPCGIALGLSRCFRPAGPRASDAVGAMMNPKKWVACGLVVLAGCSAKAELKVAPQPAPTPTPVQTVAQPVQSGDAVLEGDRIKIAKQIFYDVDKDEIRPESFPTLSAVAHILNTHSEITGVVIEGHTDSQGNFEHNHKLSERRANAVVRFLAQTGVKQPIQAAGYGATAPICQTPDDACLQMNRRVEFKVKRAQ
jgi:peptidoglycan-associated lipoprotein